MSNTNLISEINKILVEHNPIKLINDTVERIEAYAQGNVKSVEDYLSIPEKVFALNLVKHCPTKVINDTVEQIEAHAPGTITLERLYSSHADDIALMLPEVGNVEDLQARIYQLCVHYHEYSSRLKCGNSDDILDFTVLEEHTWPGEAGKLEDYLPIAEKVFVLKEEYC